MSQKRTLSFLFFKFDESLSCQTSWREIWVAMFIDRFNMKLLTPPEDDDKLGHFLGFLIQIVEVAVALEFVRYFEPTGHY